MVGFIFEVLLLLKYHGETHLSCEATNSTLICKALGADGVPSGRTNAGIVRVERIEPDAMVSILRQSDLAKRCALKTIRKG